MDSGSELGKNGISKIRDFGSEVWDLGFGVGGLGVRIWDSLGFGVWDLGFGVWDLGFEV